MLYGLLSSHRIHDSTAFPDAKVRITPLFSRGNHILVIHREKVDVFEILAEDIIAFCIDASDRGQLGSDGCGELWCFLHTGVIDPTVIS